jgi:hypothetical protein
VLGVVHCTLSAPPRKVLAVGCRGLYHALWRSSCLTVSRARLAERGLGCDERRGVGSGSLLDRLASLLGANKVLVYQYLITFVGVTSGIVLLGEGLGVEKIVGGAIILFGVYLTRRQ